MSPEAEEEAVEILLVLLRDERDRLKQNLRTTTRTIRALEAAQNATVPHGSCYAYNNLSCRCDHCREAHNEYQRNYRARSSQDPQ